MQKEYSVCQHLLRNTLHTSSYTLCTYTGSVHLHCLEHKYIHRSILVPSVLMLAPYRAWSLWSNWNGARLLWWGSSSNTHVWPVSARILIGGNSHCSPSALLRFTAISEINSPEESAGAKTPTVKLYIWVVVILGDSITVLLCCFCISCWTAYLVNQWNKTIMFIGFFRLFIGCLTVLIDPNKKARH